MQAPHALSPPSRRAPPAAFSLVEVTIALGIAAVGLLSIVSLLSIAMGGVRDAAADLIAPKIASRTIADLQLMPWAEVPSLHGQLAYFDREGLPLDPQLPGQSIFTSLIQVEDLSPIARSVQVFVAMAPGDAAALLFDADTPPSSSPDPRVQIFPTRLVRMEK